jgi:peroxiredoxin
MSMTIKEGDRLPDCTFYVMGDKGPEVRSTSDVFLDRTVALFGLPGAYTPVCHTSHLPGIVRMSETLKQQGVDIVACTAVNDIFVMDHWAAELEALGKVFMLADGNGDFAEKCGLAVDLRKFGLGVRSNRYAMVVSNGVVRVLGVEDVLMSHDKSSAASLNAKLARSEAV